MSAYQGPEKIRQVSPGHPEFSLYVAIKLHVYRCIVRAERDMGLAPGNLNARRLHRLLTMQPSRSRDTHRFFTDFYDISPYFVRERMKNLNHGTILQESSRGTRGLVNYRWNEPITASNVASFRNLYKILGEHLNLALDLHRLYDEFGLEPFTWAAYVSSSRRRREQFVERKWYKISTRTPSDSPEYTHFLNNRLHQCIRLGFIRPHGQGYVLDTRVEEVATWFELFAYSAMFGRTST